MGLSEALETAITGVFFVLVIAAVIVAIWPQLVFYLSNAEVFATGAVTLALIGFLVLIFVIAIIIRIFKDTKSERQSISNVFNRRQDEDL